MKKKCLLMVMVLTGMCVFTACGKKDSTADSDAAVTDAATDETAAADDAEVTEAPEEEAADTATGTATVTYEMPAEFTESETAGMYFGPDYPDDSSNIYVMSMDNDTTSLSMSEDELVAYVESSYSSQYQIEVDVNCSEYTKTTIDGYDALIVRMDYEFNGIAINQVETVVQIGTGTTTISCTQQGDADWMDTFNTLMDSVHVVTE